MTATIIKLSIQRMICTGCGAEANASCNCGKTYVPAAQRAKEEAQKDPSASVRTIAERASVGVRTAHEAKQAVSEETPAMDTVLGRDGKQYPAKSKRHRGRRMSDVPDEPQHERDLRMLEGVWDGACESARQAFIDVLRGRGCL